MQTSCSAWVTESNAYYKYDTSNLSQVEEEYDGFLERPQLTNTAGNRAGAI